MNNLRKSKETLLSTGYYYYYYLTDKMKRSFFQAAVVSILLYGCTTWTLTKRLERRLDGNYTRMLRAVLNKSWRQHPTRLQLYGHLPPITKTIQVRRTRHAGHCWRSKDELISDVLLWTPTHGCARVGRPARTYIQQLCEDTGCNPEDLPEAMNDREKWRETVRDIRAGGATWWWWWLLLLYSLRVFHTIVRWCSFTGVWDSTSLRVSRTLLRNVADVSNALVWMVLILSLISNPSTHPWISNSISLSPSSNFSNCFLIPNSSSLFLPLIIIIIVVVVFLLSFSH